MKKLLFILSILINTPAFGQVSYIEEAQQLGSIAGQGQICNAKKKDTFEMLARAIILTKAPNEATRDKALKAYIDEKVRAYMIAKKDCEFILQRFDNQDIFKIKIYKDGTISFADGTTIKPKIPYDASQI